MSGMVDQEPRPQGLRAPYGGDTGQFSIAVDVGAGASMTTLVEVIRGLEDMTDIGLSWGTSLARSAATWDLGYELGQLGLYTVYERAMREGMWPLGLERLRPLESQHGEWLGYEDPELTYLRDVRAQRLLGTPPRVTRLTYENPVELILIASGLMLTGITMAARFVRDLSANLSIGRAEARKAEAEARVAETWADREEAVTAAATTWLSDEARRTATPLPIGEMAAITSNHNFADLRRVIERPVTLELPTGLDRTTGHSA